MVLSAAVAEKKLKELALVYKRGKGVMGVITTSNLAEGGGGRPTPTPKQLETIYSKSWTKIQPFALLGF